MLQAVTEMLLGIEAFVFDLPAILLLELGGQADERLAVGLSEGVAPSAGRKSERVMPGLPLRRILSPAATSIT